MTFYVFATKALLYGCYRVQDGPKGVKFVSAAYDDVEKCSVYQNVQILV